MVLAVSLARIEGLSHRIPRVVPDNPSTCSPRSQRVGRLARAYVCSRLVIIVDTNLHTDQGQDEMKEISSVVAITQVRAVHSGATR